MGSDAALAQSNRGLPSAVKLATMENPPTGKYLVTKARIRW